MDSPLKFYGEPAKLPGDARVKSARVHSSSLLCTLLLCPKYIHSPNWLLSLNAMLSGRQCSSSFLLVPGWRGLCWSRPWSIRRRVVRARSRAPAGPERFQLDLALGAKEHLVLPLVALKHLQLVVHWLAKKEQKKLE